MNKQQIDQVIVHLNSYDEVDLKASIAEQNSGQDLRNVMFGEYNATQFYQFSNRMIKQFRAEFESDNKIIFPYQYNFGNEFGNGDLHSDLVNYVANIKGRNFVAAVQHLNRLIYYQMTNGFWDKSNAKVHSLRGLQVSSLEEKLDLLSEQLENNIQSFDILKITATEEIESLENFKVNKEKELLQISSNLSISNQETGQISEILNNSISTNEKIIALLEKGESKLEDINEDASTQKVGYKEQQKELSAFIDNVNKQLSSFQKKNAEFKSIVEEVEGKKEFFDERNNYLTDLIGREVGASLFESFKQRKKELKPSVEFWKKAVPTMALITIIGVYAIFSNLFGLLPTDPNSTENAWRIFALRGLKSIPLFILLYFTIQQYTKERHYKEEYAFKSAVALTIKAYSDLIVDRERKDEMIFNSVTGVYKSPNLQKEKRSNEKSPIKEIADIVKTTTDTTSEAIKKIR